MTEIEENRAKMPLIGSSRYQSAASVCLMGGIFFLPLYLPAAVVLLACAGLLWMGRMILAGEVSLRRTPLDVWVAGFVCLAAASVSQSAHAAEGWYNYFCLVGLYVLVYVLITQTVNSRIDGERLLLALMASAAVVCVWGLLQYNAGIDVTAERWIDDSQFPGLKTRVFSTLGNPNVLAAFLVMVVGLSSGWALDVRHRKFKWSLILLSALSVVCILLTYSRGAWLSLGVMAVLMVTVWRHWSWRILLGGVVTAAILWFMVQDSFMARLLSIKGMFNPADSSVALRWALWESTLAMIHEYPWLGLGWGSYRFVYPEYDFFVQNASVTIYHGHNTILSFAAEIGIPGAVCFAVAWGIAVMNALKAMKQADRIKKGFFLGFALALLGMAAFSLTDHVLFNIQVAAIFWVLLALMASIPSKQSENIKRVWVFKKK